MGGELEAGRNYRKKLINIRSEKGYLMLSTLYLLILTGIFSQSIIKTSANYIIQLNQISSTYQAKAALNMSERVLKDYIVDNDYELPEKVKLSSSIGDIKGIKISDDEYELVITQENGNQLNEKVKIENYKNEEDKIKPLDIYDAAESNRINELELIEDTLEIQN